VRVDIITIFPDYFAPLDLSLIGRARGTGLLDVAVHDLRDWTSDVHRTVDDTPYGGGPGMVMRPEPWAAALDAVAPVAGPAGGGPLLVVPTPVGAPFTQATAHRLAAADHLVFACGRYEGIDQRVLDEAATRMPVVEVSLGDYVLFGGEVAVIVIMEAVTRLLPGVLGNADSLAEESHAAGLLEAPVYTKPAEWRGHEVPPVLRSGDHGRIARWRRDQSLLRTAGRRPDMLAALPAEALDKGDRATLEGAGFQVPGVDVAK
jgi:tRNA (guanine37-N1)-methyltransferase